MEKKFSPEKWQFSEFMLAVFFYSSPFQPLKILSSEMGPAEVRFI
jgi:hypothetical protein